MTDAGEFERLATAVLRSANPHYAALIHSGVNAEGRPVASPVDGFTLGGGSNSAILVAHTTMSSARLTAKWLHETQGDIAKAAEVAARLELTNAKVVLTVSREPTLELAVAAQRASAEAGLRLDLWPQSRIADFLDDNAEGQWIRRRFFGEPESRLSPTLLQEISRRGPLDLSLFDTAQALSPRQAASELTGRLFGGQRFVLLNAPSGQGKTVVALQVWREAVDSGAFAIHVTHEDVEASSSFVDALDRALRRHSAHLAPGCGRLALDLAARQPVLVLVEDVNRAVQPVAALEKVILWQRQETAQGLRVLCPVWPRGVASLRDQESKAIADCVIWLELPSHEEAVAIAAAHAADQGHDPTLLPLDTIVSRLGRDPLLLGLHDYQVHTADGVRAFIKREATRLASRSALAGTDLLDALDALALGMLRNRSLEPPWRHVREWVGAEKSAWLRVLADAGTILRFSGEGSCEHIVFRHDRVRDYIRARALRRMLEAGAPGPTEVLIEPAYAELWGAVLSEHDAPSDWIARASDLNPLGLFQGAALSATGSARRVELLIAARAWLQRPGSLDPDYKHLRWSAQGALVEVEDPLVVEMLPLFRETTWMTRESACWNGDMEAALRLTMSWDPFRLRGHERRVFDHLRARHAAPARAFVEAGLRRADVTEDRKIALIAFAGRLRDPSIAPLIAETWRLGPRSPKFINASLWAAANSETDLLPEILEAWAELAESPQEHGSTPRGSVGYDLRSEFWATGSRRILDLLLVRVRDPDDPLSFYVGNLIEGWDEPDAQEAYVRLLARRVAQARETGGYGLTGYHLGEMWAEQGFLSGHVMSDASLARLADLWRDESQDLDVRRLALRLWGHAARRRHLAAVRSSPALEPVGPLGPEAVCALIHLEDPEAPAALERLIEADPTRAYMVQELRGRWREAYLPLLLGMLERRRRFKAGAAGEYFKGDHALPDLMRELDDSQRTRLLQEHWDHLQEERGYIHLALWTATPMSLELARRSLQAGDPTKILQFISQHYSLYPNSQPPTAEVRRLAALEPWLSFLDDSAFRRLDEHCNRQGWHDWRRTHVDPRLGSMEGASWRTVASRQLAFNRAADEGGKHHPVHWDFERMVSSVGDQRSVLDEVEAWLRRRCDPAALQIACEFVIEANSRAEIPRLQAWRGLGVSGGDFMIDDAVFAVKRRTLS